jgi:hypothetical protein
MPRRKGASAKANAVGMPALMAASDQWINRTNAIPATLAKNMADNIHAQPTMLDSTIPIGFLRFFSNQNIDRTSCVRL